MSAKDIEAFEKTDVPINLDSAYTSSSACAQKEDFHIFFGSKTLAIPGLLTTKGVLTNKLKEWKQVGDGVEQIIQAVSLLDNSGFHGPYSLALSPLLYNQLFRRYPDGATIEIEHLGSLVTKGIVKAPSLKEGGVLLASGKEYASIVIGQDLLTAYEGPSGRDYVFVISESLALRLTEPGSVCVLK